MSGTDPTEKNFVYEESDTDPGNEDFKFLNDLEAFGILSKSVERAEDINRRCNCLAVERMMEFEKVKQAN
jgi:hypothetical protein